MINREEVVRDLAGVINKYSLENDNNTPDFILAEYLLGCLDNFTRASVNREEWYGKKLEIKYDEPSAFKSTGQWMTYAEAKEKGLDKTFND
jgi:hypothetical protein